ncbi:MAG: hypothetical protein ABI693_27655 [Bryobacteraceae bacterium]
MNQCRQTQVNANGELSTWTEIADYLGVSIRKAQDYERHEGMPVHRLGGKKPRVWAYRAEIEEWKKTKSYTKNGTAPVAPRRGTARWAVEGILPGLTARRLLYTAVFSSVVLAGLLLPRLVERVTPTHFQVRGNTLIALDANDRELWRHNFTQSLSDDPIRDRENFRDFWCSGGADDRRGVCIVRIMPISAGNIGSWLTCFRHDGTRLWQFTPGRDVTDEGGSHMRPPYGLTNLRVLNRSNGDVRIVALSSHYLNQPCQVAILNLEGAVVAEYWHPGHLRFIDELDVDGDGRNEVLIGGVNNGDHQATLIALDPWTAAGVSTPLKMKDHRFRLLGMTEAKEKAVVLFPRSCASAGQPYTRVITVRVMPQRVLVNVAEGTNETASAVVVYEFDHRLNPVNAEAGGTEYKAAHDELQAKGKLNHPYAHQEFADLRSQVEVRRSW